MKVFLALVSCVLLLSGCNTNKVVEDKPVSVELYLIHSKLTSYNNFPIDARRDWIEDVTLDNILQELPNGAEPEVIYETTLQTNWDQKTVKEEYNRVSWNLYNKEYVNKIDGLKPNISQFKFEFTPTLQTARNLLKMNFTLDLLKEAKYAELAKEYYPIYNTFRDSKVYYFTKNKFHVLSVMALDNKESLILLYKIKN